MLFKEPSRPFDPTAASLLNLILGEERLIANEADRYFALSHGSFYSDTVVVFANGTELKKDIDYKILVFHNRAALATAKPVGCIIRILNKTVPSVSVDYQCVGGPYSELHSALLDTLEGIGDTIKSPIKWDEIVNKPEKYNSAAHMHPYWELSGWNLINGPLNEILNGVYYRDIPEYKKIYDYLDTLIGSYETTLDNQIQALTNKLAAVVLGQRDPLGAMRFKLDELPPGSTVDGNWTAIADRVLGATTVNANIGTTRQLSKDIVVPVPDNIILDEDLNPILRDDDEWIYRDNEFPVQATSDTDDYDEEYDEEFDLLHVKGYRKVSHGSQMGATAAASVPAIVEGQSVTFKLTTHKYPGGLSIPYEITGVNDGNIDVSKFGNVAIGLDGTASLTVALLAGGPATGTTTMSIEFMIAGGVKTSTGITVASNSVRTLSILPVTGFNDIRLSKHILNETFYLLLQSHNFTGRTVSLSVAFDNPGSNTIAINGVTSTRQDVVLSSAETYVKIKTTRVGGFAGSTINFSVADGGTTYVNAAVPCSALSGSFKAYSLDKSAYVTSIADGENFILVVEHNSVNPVNFSVSTISNTVGADMNAEIPKVIYGLTPNRAESSLLYVNRKNTNRSDSIVLSAVSQNGEDMGSLTISIQPA